MHAQLTEKSMIKGYETKDVKASKTKAKHLVASREEGVMAYSRWRTMVPSNGDNGQGYFTTEEFAKIALARLSNEQ